MSGHVTVAVLDDGRTVAVKRAPGADLGPEAALLQRIDHEGVVRFVGLEDRDGTPALLTEYVGPRTMATCGRLPAERAAELAADLATTVADLHRQGITHGAIRPEHVLVAGERTVLCGFSRATTEPAPEVTDDVDGIGRVLQAALDPDTSEEPIPDHRPWARPRWDGYRHRALLTLADQATAEEPGRRPSARALADAIAQVHGRPERAARRAPEDGPGPVTALADLARVRLRHRSGARHVPRAVAIVGLGAAVVLLGGWAYAHRPPAETEPIAAAVPVAPACPPSEGRGRPVDLDGDGCPETARLGPGWLEVDGRRFTVGAQGDDLALGDWDCDGQSTVALLRPATGEVWAFARWDPDAPVEADPLGTVEGATGLERRAAAMCDLLVADLTGGRTQEVAVP